MAAASDDSGPEELEAAEAATVDGDVAYRPGTARAALAHRDFALVWAGSMASNVGTWMQNVALGAFAYSISHSASYVAFLGFMQLGPLLLLAILGGVLADAVDRRLLLILAQAEQMIFSFVLAFVCRGHHPSRNGIAACVLAIGVGNALNAPAFSAVLPVLVGKRDLAGAISLQSVQLNLSRVIGPAIGGLILPAVGAAGVFAINGATYLFAIATLWPVHIPRPYPSVGEQGIRRLVSGFAIARNDVLVRRCLLTMFTISLLCLPFIGLMPVLAAQRFHLSPTSVGYGVMYAGFGLGAAFGAISVGTVFVDADWARLFRLTLAGFGVALGAFASARSAVAAYPVAVLVGFTYFASVTTLSTLLQEHLDEMVRGRVMALWIMAFGGTVPIGILLGGALAGRTSIAVVVYSGAVAAGLIAATTRLRRPAVG